MTAIEERPAGAVVSAYGLRRPSATDLRRAIERIFGEDADDVWKAVLDEAGVVARLEDGLYDVIVDAMHHHPDGAVRLCAESFLIRANAFEHLYNAETIVRSAT